MIWHRSSSVHRTDHSFGRPVAMGQLSSSELPTVANAISVQSQTPSADLETKPEIGNEAALLEKMVIRPSQPIDICRGPSQPRNVHLHHLQRPTAQRVPLRSASEIAPPAQKCPSVVRLAPPPSPQKGHQPRVIQPRRMAANGENGTTKGGGGEGEQTKDWGREGEQNSGTGHKRSRGLTVDIPPTQPNSQRERTEQREGPNKENGQQQQQQGARTNSTGTGSSSSKSSRNSRKRLNSLELDNMDYDALEGTSSAEAKTVENDQQKAIEAKEMKSESKQKEFDAGQMTKEGNGTFGHGEKTVIQTTDGTMRRRADGGRIAYLYGVYGANSDTSATAFGATDRRTRQHRRSAFADQANTRVNDGAGWDDCCCFEEEEDDEEAGTDELFKMTRGCLVHSLHTVSDIIGYAKVVRAQRNETLGRLNDVMSQFDALIRSYSLAIKNGANISRQFDVPAGQSFGANRGDSANGILQGQTQLEPAA